MAMTASMFVDECQRELNLKFGRPMVFFTNVDVARYETHASLRCSSCGRSILYKIENDTPATRYGFAFAALAWNRWLELTGRCRCDMAAEPKPTKATAAPPAAPSFGDIIQQRTWNEITARQAARAPVLRSDAPAPAEAPAEDTLVTRMKSLRWVREVPDAKPSISDCVLGLCDCEAVRRTTQRLARELVASQLGDEVARAVTFDAKGEIRFDGFTAVQCLAVFTSVQRDTSRADALSPAQLAVARSAWKAKLAERQRETHARAERQVLVDVQDID